MQHPMPSDSSAPAPALTLAKGLQIMREVAGLTQVQLAERANISLELLQDLETGLELFMAPSIRQKLARVLKVRPGQIKVLEKDIHQAERSVSPDTREHYLNDILSNPEQPQFCPFCRAPLQVRIFNRKDLDDNLLVEVKANCSRCLFKL